MKEKIKVVIVGGGFSGLTVLRKLLKSQEGKSELTLIDKSPEFWFKTRLIDFFNDESEDNAAIPFREIFEDKKVNYIQAQVDRTNLEGRNITLHNGSVIPYDYLVLSQGSEVSVFNLTAHKNAFHFFRNKGSVWDIKKRVEELFIESDGKVDIAVVGGGPTGSELIFALKKFIKRRIIPDYPELKNSYSLKLVQAGPEIVATFSERVKEWAHLLAKKENISIITNFRVSDVGDGVIKSADGREIKADMIIWTAGIEQSRIVVSKNFKLDRNNCWTVDKFLRLNPRVFSGGDASCFLRDGRPVPKNAQTAILMGNSIASNIINSINKKSLVPFEYSSKGSMLLLGNEAALEVGSLSWCGVIPRCIRDFYYRFKWRQLTK